MGLYKITVKKTCTFGKITLEKGMSVEIIYNLSPLGYNQGKDLAIQAFLNKYGIDCKNLMSPTYFDVEKIN